MHPAGIGGLAGGPPPPDVSSPGWSAPDTYPWTRAGSATSPSGAPLRISPCTASGGLLPPGTQKMLTQLIAQRGGRGWRGGGTCCSSTVLSPSNVWKMSWSFLSIPNRLTAAYPCPPQHSLNANTQPRLPKNRWSAPPPLPSPSPFLPPLPAPLLLPPPFLQLPLPLPAYADGFLCVSRDVGLESR